MNKYKLGIIIGKTGSGKDSIWQAIPESDFVHKVISTTTRPMREYEHQDVHYHFIDKYDFITQDNLDQFLDTSIFNGWYYGTHINDLDRDKVNLIIADNTRLTDLLVHPDVRLCIFMIDATDKERILRCLNREDDPDVKEIVRRFSAEEEDYKSKEFLLVEKYIRPLVHISNHDDEMEQAVAAITERLEEWAKQDK